MEWSKLGYALALIVLLYVVYNMAPKLGVTLTLITALGIVGYQYRNKSGIFGVQL